MAPMLQRTSPVSRLSVTLGSEQKGKQGEESYEILVFDGKREWSVHRRQQDFDYLAQTVQSRQGPIEASALPALPRKPQGLRMRFSNHYRDKHYKELKRWVQMVTSEPCFATLPELLQFLEPPESARGPAATEQLGIVGRRPLRALEHDAVSSGFSTVEQESSFSSQDCEQPRPESDPKKVQAAMQLYSQVDFQLVTSMDSVLLEENHEALGAMEEARAVQQVREAARAAAHAEVAARAAAEADVAAAAAEQEARAIAEVRSVTHAAMKAEASARAAVADAAARAEAEARALELGRASRVRQARASKEESLDRQRQQIWEAVEADSRRQAWEAAEAEACRQAQSLAAPQLQPTAALPYADKSLLEQGVWNESRGSDSGDECFGCNGTGVNVLGNPCGMCHGHSTLTVASRRRCDSNASSSSASSVDLQHEPSADLQQLESSVTLDDAPAQAGHSFMDEECFGCNGTGVDVLGNICRMCNGSSMLQVTHPSLQASLPISAERLVQKRPASIASTAPESLASSWAGVSEAPKLHNVGKANGRAERFVDKVNGDKEIQRINCCHTAAAVLDLHHSSADISEVLATYLSKAVQVHELITKNSDADFAFARLSAAYRHLVEGLPWLFGRRGEVHEIDPDEDFSVFQGVAAMIPPEEDGEVAELSRLRRQCMELLDLFHAVA